MRGKVGDALHRGWAAIAALVASPLLAVAAARSYETGGAAARWLLAAAVAVAIGALLVESSRLGRRERRLRRLTAAVERLVAGGEPEEPVLAAYAANLGEERRRLVAERDHHREIVEAMSDGVLEAGPDGRVRLANAAFRRLFGIEGPVEGRTVLELTRRPELGEVVDGTLGGGAPGDREVALVDGGIALLSGVPSHQGGALLVARDLTDRVRLEATRRDFVANISHELKTPLTAIRGYAETLQGGARHDREVAARFTSKILGQCARLEALLGDLLALSRLESASFQTEENRRPTDLGQLCRRCLEVMSGPARERGVRLEFAQAEMPPLIGYPEALERMLLNLLDNAIKYNREGGWVRIALESGEGCVVLEISDSGIGIPEAARARVFERFYRVDKGRARDEGGTGLGLALVKHAVRLHGGSVEVESELGRGSRFRVVLPVPEA